MFKLRKLWWMALISAAIALWYWQRQWATRLRALPAPPPATDSLAGSPFATDLDALIIDHEPSWAAYTEPAPPAEPAPPLDVVATEGGVSAEMPPSSVTEPITGDTPDTADTAEAVSDQITASAPAPEAAAPADVAPDQIAASASAPEAAAPADAASAPAPEAAASEVAPPPNVPVQTASAAQPERVNINTASITKLTTLPGIGPTLARRIVAYRKANGPFTSVEGLLKVQGIGMNNLKDFIDRIQV